MMATDIISLTTVELLMLLIHLPTHSFKSSWLALVEMETLDLHLVLAVALVHCTGELIFLLLQLEVTR
jgi:hypothetical protein